VLGVPGPGLRIVSCHLGAGASLCAIADGRSVDTTMGFTPLEGLVMATRSGSVDPGLLLWLMERAGMAERELTDALEHGSGLRGLAGTADMREVLSRADSGERDAQLARDVYVHRLRAGIAAMAASLDGLDVLVFTGGVGERAPDIRSRAVAGLGFFGLGIDAPPNLGAEGDAEITGGGAVTRTFVVTAREDLEIGGQARLAVHAYTDRSISGVHETVAGSRVSICASPGVRRACLKPRPTSTSMTTARMKDAIAPQNMIWPIFANGIRF
jgi:acetate kinase